MASIICGSCSSYFCWMSARRMSIWFTVATAALLGFPQVDHTTIAKSVLQEDWFLFFSSAELRCGLLSSLIDMVISLVWVADILSAAFLIGLTTLVLGCDAVSSLLPYELILPLLPLRLFLLSIYGFVASSYDSGVSVCAFISTIVDLAHMISTLCLLTLDLVREYFPLTINIVAYR